MLFSSLEHKDSFRIGREFRNNEGGLGGWGSSLVESVHDTLKFSSLGIVSLVSLQRKMVLAHLSSS